MEPIPETTEAVDELDAFVADDDLLEQLGAVATRVRVLVPDCVGMSVAMINHGITLTLVATVAEIAALDAVQYLAGGPCVTAAERGEVLATTSDSLDERGWHLFAGATAAHGVVSTLSLPLMEDGEVVGGVNLYGGTRDAFDGHHDELATILGAWAGGAVANADLSFDSRLEAQRAPQVLRDAAQVDLAVGMLAATLDVDVTGAGDRLAEAAARAGVALPAMADMVAQLLSRRPR